MSIDDAARWLQDFGILDEALQSRGDEAVMKRYLKFKDVTFGVVPKSEWPVLF